MSKIYRSRNALRKPTPGWVIVAGLTVGISVSLGGTTAGGILWSLDKHLAATAAWVAAFAAALLLALSWRKSAAVPVEPAGSLADVGLAEAEPLTAPTSHRAPTQLGELASRVRSSFDKAA